MGTCGLPTKPFSSIYTRGIRRDGEVGGGGAKTHKILPVIFDIGNAKTHKILPVIFDIGNSSLCDLTMVKPHKCNRV